MLEFDHVNLRVPESELIKEKNFFCQILGLENSKRPEFQNKGFWLHDTKGNVVIHLSILDAEKVPISNTGAIDHIAFKSSGVDEFYQHLITSNITTTIKYRENINLTLICFFAPAGVQVEMNFSNEALGKT